MKKAATPGTLTFVTTRAGVPTTTTKLVGTVPTGSSATTATGASMTTIATARTVMDLIVSVLSIPV